MVTKTTEQSEYLSRSVSELLNNLQKFADGDLTVRYDKQINNDTVGKLFLGFNKTVSKISETLGKVNKSSVSTTRAQREIATLCD